MKSNLKFITVILATFAIAFATSLLLDLPIFKHWLRQFLVVFLVALELFFGAIVLLDLVNPGKK